jgi:hypothetical protein
MLFQGFTATALRDAPYAGVFLVVYEGFKHRLGEYASLISRTVLSDLVGRRAHPRMPFDPSEERLSNQ